MLSVQTALFTICHPVGVVSVGAAFFVLQSWHPFGVKRWMCVISYREIIRVKAQGLAHLRETKASEHHECGNAGKRIVAAHR